MQKMKNTTELLKKYVANPEYRKSLGMPEAVTESYEKLAQGEYNVNYLFAHPVTGRKLILRINTGSQMHLDRQIEYEAHALGLLETSGRTPKIFYCDGSKKVIDQGVLVMEYLPGVYPDYEDREDMTAVIECLADIHSMPVQPADIVYGEPEKVPRDTVRLIAPDDPAEAILDECESMVKTYMDSPDGNDDVKKRLRKLLDKGHMLALCKQNDHSLRCCVNTELNSTNFLLDSETDQTGANRRFARLVDWEKPLYADPAQDLAHLLAPTTTFWKTDVILEETEVEFLIGEYIKAVGGRFDTEGVRERTERLINITCLRGLTWCAMAWVQYRDPDKLIVNESTKKKLDAYLSDSFIKNIESRF